MAKEVQKNSILPHLPWIVPLIMALLGLSFEVYSVVAKVKALETRSYKGEAALRELENIKYRVNSMEIVLKDERLERRVIDLEYRMSTAEDWCCSETQNKIK